MATLLGLPADGAMIAFDPFDYPPGAIAGRNGGTGFSTAFLGNGQVSAGSLAYTDSQGAAYSSTGNRVSTNTSGNGMIRVISAAGQPPTMVDQNGRFGVDGSRVYLGFLTRLDSGIVNAFGDYGGISLFDGGAEHIFFGDPGFAGTHRFWGVDPQEGSGAVRDSSAPVNSTVRLLIARIDFAPGAEAVRFYVDPPLADEPSTPTIGPFLVHDFRFTVVRLQGGGAGRYGFDELALGSTYADVVPEPGTAAFLAASALVLVRRRHERIRREFFRPVIGA